MPELPEVEHARRTLVRALGADPIVRAETADAIVVPQGPEVFATLVGARVVGSERRGKSVLLRLSGPGARELALFFHLGMTGRLVVRDAPAAEPVRFARWTIATAARAVTLADARRLGRARVGAYEEVARDSGFDELGPDALEVTTGPALAACFAGRGGRPLAAPIKTALMDQSRLAGLGNIHAAEALFLARIHPDRATGSLRAAEWEALARGVHETLSRTLASMRDDEELVYVSDGGPNPFHVYGKEGEPCPACGAPIRRDEHAGRGTYYCGKCQKKTRAR
jgi:formamidopyrimidine-DNA glycosylase